jgi:hypothetical protein
MLSKPQAFSFMLSVIFCCMLLSVRNGANAKAQQSPLPSYQQAIERASTLTGVPKALLICIAKVESGRSTPQGVEPWPWAINVAGIPKYFMSKKEALAYVSKCLSQGITNIDVGILQLNIKWHSQGFTHLEAMLDPHFNALYAARFLKRLRLQHGSWAKAVATYHSSQPHRGQAYITKVAAHLTFKLPPNRKASPLKYAASRQILPKQPKQRTPS